MTIFTQQFLLRKVKVDATGELVSLNRTLSSQIVRAQDLAENTSFIDKFFLSADQLHTHNGRLRSLELP